MRVIVHLDADAFFASVEQAADSRLRGKAIAVGGEKRGIIASASYEARKFGVYTPMPTSRARKLCPRLIVLPGDFEKYEHFSRWMFSYAQDFTPDVEIASIDEGYFDLSAVRKPALHVAETIRTAIRQSLKISVSEGIGSNKLISQIASKLTKPAAFHEVALGTEIEFLHPLPNHWLPGIGPQTSQRLNAAGLAFIRHIAATPTDLLHLLVGKAAPALKSYADGIDERPVTPMSAPAKSYGQQQTFATDITDEDYAEAVLRRMADELMAKVRADGKSIRTLTVKVRYNDMAEDQCGDSLGEPTDLESELYGRIGVLFRQAWKRRVSLRLVSLKLSNVYDGIGPTELHLEGWGRRQDAVRRLAYVVDELRETHGREVILRGHDFRLREPATDSAALLNPSPSRQAARPPARTSQPSIAPSLTPVYSAKGRAEQRPSRRPSRHTGHPVALHVHSPYSFLDSTLSIPAIVELAARHELPAVALTDAGNLHGAVDFCLAARQAGIQPIVGAEINVDGESLCLYVETATGYANLCRLLSGQDGLPAPASRWENDFASENLSEAIPPPRGNHFSLARLRRQPLDGLLAASRQTALAPLFPDRFYRAVASEEEWKRGPDSWPGVWLQPVHYALPADRMKFDIVQSIRTRTLLMQAHPEKRFDGHFHFLPPDEVQSIFPEYPALLEHTAEIAGRCSFALKAAPPQFPAFTTPDGSTPREFLRQLVWDGLHRRYGNRAGAMRGQVDEELGIIAEVGYEDYFLVVVGILDECRRDGIDWITRGSAADSLVCYCLGISDVCPVRFDLYFRRFLNKERMGMNKLPDIDIDFPHDRKDDVIDLIFRRHGAEHAAVVGGFSTFQVRSAFAEVAKVLGVAEREVRKFTDHFPWSFGGGWVPNEPTPKGGEGLVGMLRASPENRDLPFDEEPYRTALNMAEFLDGMPRYPKMHPCGVVLSRQPMHELTPTFISNKGYPTTHFDMDAIETIGLVKIDVLAQGGLAVMRDARCELAQRAIEINPAALEPWEDPNVWEMIAAGGSRAVHHIESPAMVSLARQCNVRDIDGLIALVSVIRPGAANEGKKQSFSRRYQDLEPITSPHPSLDMCLKSTFGLVVYEEHILQICEAFAGLRPGRADVLRRALAKHKEPLIEEIHQEFIGSARARGHDEEKIAEIWALVRGFAGYAFCKAHSTAYGVEAYQSAWLKRYHPVEFMAAVLSNGKGFYHPLVYVLETRRLGIPFLPPTINRPGPKFGVEAGSIRVPVTRVKGLSQRTPERLVEEWQRGSFVSLADFYRRVVPAREEMEAMLRVGAFDEFGKSRTAQFWEVQQLYHTFGVTADAAQGWLLPAPSAGRLPGVPLQEPTPRQRLEWEAELLDFTASGHPLALHDHIAWDTYCSVNRLGEYIGQQIVTCGLIIEQRTHHQITGEPMKFLTLADWTGMVETELFAATYRSYGLATVRYPVLEVTATVEPYENRRGFSLRVLRAGRPRRIHDAGRR
ncbi:MAG: polymerase subunit alpha [Verrucomicrobiota bacterium]|jgi:DNA-directed DNA polymerase III PolC